MYVCISQKFGDIEDLQEEESPLSVVLTFKSRSEAENVSRVLETSVVLKT